MVMEPVIHSGRVEDIQVSAVSIGLELGAPVRLVLSDSHEVQVFANRASSFPFGLGRRSSLLLGYLETAVAERLVPALERNAPMRVRIVEIDPSHLRTDGRDRICISVWAKRDDLMACGLLVSGLKQSPR